MSAELDKTQHDQREKEQRFNALIDYHTDKARNHTAAASEAREPSEAGWHQVMAKLHSLWASDLQALSAQQAIPIPMPIPMPVPQPESIAPESA